MQCITTSEEKYIELEPALARVKTPFSSSYLFFLLFFFLLLALSLGGAIDLQASLLGSLSFLY